MTLTASNTSPAQGAYRIDAVILFAELRGFTQLSDVLEPATVIGMLDDYHTLLAAAIRSRTGKVLNVLGDTLMTVFAGNEAATQHAVLAAQDVLRDFSTLEQTWRARYGLNAAVAMGLHKGEVVFGRGTAFNLPQAFGDCVTVASRLLQRARAGEFVMSSAVFDALSAAQFELAATPLPALECPRREPIQLYGVLLDTRLDFT